MTKPNELTVHRVKFKRWAELEDKREQFVRAADENADNFPQKFFAYLSAALNVKEEELEGLHWIECVELFYKVYLANLPSPTLPLITATSKDLKSSKLEWDYPGRVWFLYANILSSAYGWTLEYIAELEIDDALALVQEILTDQQLAKEFTWGMSEAAYSYNKSTKTSKFNPLPRPAWMLPAVREIKKIKIRKDLMPQGLIIDAGTNKELKYS